MVLVARHNALRFRIEPDLPEVGWYLLVYAESGNCIADYLQDSSALAQAFAQKEFRVPPTAWTQVEQTS